MQNKHQNTKYISTKPIVPCKKETKYFGKLRRRKKERKRERLKERKQERKKERKKERNLT
jgi:hypothetical protein